MANLIVHDRARQDIEEITSRIAIDNLKAALRVHRAIEKAFQILVKFPDAGAICDPFDPELAGLRFWPLKRYRNYLVIYRPIEDGIEVVRVIHAARDMFRMLKSR